MRVFRLSELPASPRPHSVYYIAQPGNRVVEYVTGSDGVPRAVEPADPGDLAAIFNSA